MDNLEINCYKAEFVVCGNGKIRIYFYEKTQKDGDTLIELNKDNIRIFREDTKTYKMIEIAKHKR